MGRMIEADASLEQWKDIQGYEGLYQVSNKGRVRSIDRVIKHYPKDYFQKGRVLKSALSKNGYPMVILVNPKDNNYEFCPYCGEKIKVVE